MHHAYNFVVRASPLRSWPFLLTCAMKKQKILKDHAEITSKTHTQAHSNAKAPNRVNTWLCVPRKPRIIRALS
jgi:hypothetical protein